MIPILSTKADDLEGNGSINATIANLAIEYNTPLWNFWSSSAIAARWRTPGRSGASPTWGRNFFNDPETLTKAWPIRNLIALSRFWMQSGKK